MMSFGALRGGRLRAHLRMLRRIASRPLQVIYVRSSAEFRMAERLHHAHLLTACISKWNWLGPPNGRPFRELALFKSETSARQQYGQILPRHRARARPR